MMPKFRAWYKEYEEMFPVSAINFIDGRISLGSSLALCETHIDNVVLMQSTGLFDSAGVEVFCGDIVKINTDMLLAKYIHVVEWEEKNCKFNFVGYGIQKCTVIGNIHEHPHLLE